MSDLKTYHKGEYVDDDDPTPPPPPSRDFVGVFGGILDRLKTKSKGWYIAGSFNNGRRIFIRFSDVEDQMEGINKHFDNHFKELKRAFQIYIFDLYGPRDEIIKRIKAINQTIEDMRFLNKQLVQMVHRAPVKTLFKRI